MQSDDNARDDIMMATARAAGLDKVAAEFTADILAAAAAAHSFRKGLGVLPVPTAEPWPPMRVAAKPKVQP